MAAVLLAAGSVWIAPTAAAVVPPVVDDSLLPPAGPAAPPGPTEPIGDCQSGAAPVRSQPATQLAMLDLAAVQRLSRGFGQTVAVIDTGVARHRLLPRLTAGGDYVSAGDGTRDCDGHGTAVAGIVAASGDPAFSGVAPDAAILAIRQSSNEFRRTDGDAPSGVGDVETLALAVRAAADLGATVINISSVACVSADVGIDDGSLGAALGYAVDVKNAVVVSAAGNVGGQCTEQNPVTAGAGRPDWASVEVVVSPAWYDDLVLTVGSVDGDGRPSGFSLAGPWVDVAAPGESVVSLSSDGEGLMNSIDDEPVSGTSYAAPVVSGLAALVRARSPHLTARQVMQRIEQTARHPSSGWDPYVGSGVVDPLAAVSADAGPPPSTPTSGVRVAAADTVPTDSRARSVAFGGAAAAVAIVVAVAASRLRGRDVTRH
ncbi:type VII secretion-associated serine protease mycosin [Mycolicibacterium arenosum]|uniref:Type VII secretion-associated serine protease mycosin n=1 Tax=Mycolicibacterium arenosum TaxID=2952157 RepID=A0ABT1MA98_9MYCO|nr:type VII secretion-associated serine protease mycosin [Mycolicibacterium sp. CAU 1645]MCP9275475.1 type VII secretion-associated serine protease mycosin [Mycolicibacterium sp. CAU 1645]